MSSIYADKLERWSSHWYLKEWLDQCQPGTRVLDIGTATGTLGRLCMDSDVLLFGIEKVESWAEIARVYYQDVLVSSLEDIPDDYMRSYDVVVLADVLEHLPEPLSALKRVVTLQSEKTEFWISVPNIANISIRIGLLFGIFNYQSAGILDQTHLHFYTRYSLRQMMQAAGLSEIELVTTPIPLTLVHSFFRVTYFGKLLCLFLAKVTQLFPTIFGYQFLIRATKTK